MLQANKLLDTTIFTGVITTHTFNAATQVVAGIFRPKPYATITHICLYCSSAISPPTFRVSLQTVSGSTPTGTEIFGANGTFVPSANTYYEIQLATPYTVPASLNVLSACISYDSGTIGASNNASFNYRLSNITSDSLSYSKLFTGTWDTLSSSNCPCIFVKYSDGTYGITSSCPLATTSSVTLQSTGTYDEAGIKFSFPFSYRLIAFQSYSRLAATTATMRARLFSDVATRGTLFDDSNTNVLGTQIMSISSPFILTFDFPQGIYIHANEPVTLLMKNSTTSTFTVTRCTFLSEELKNQHINYGNSSVLGIYRKNDSLLLSSTTIIPLIALYVDRVTLTRQGTPITGGFL